MRAALPAEGGRCGPGSVDIRTTPELWEPDVDSLLIATLSNPVRNVGK